MLPILWRQRWLVLGCAGACLLVAVVYLIFATPLYTSTARMSVTLAASRLTGETQMITDYTAGSYLYTEQNKILSPSVLALAAQMPDVKPYAENEPDPILFLQDGLSVDVGKRDTVVAVNFSSTNRMEAAKIANGIVKAYVAYQTKPKASDTAELTRLADERKRVEDQIAQKNRQMQDLEQKYGVLATANDRDSLAERRLAALSQELHAAHLDSLRAEAEYKQAQRIVEKLKKAGVNDDEVDTDSLALGADQEGLVRTDLLSLEARLRDVRSHYLPDHPYVKSIERRRDQLQMIYARAIERRYLVTKQRESDLQAGLGEQQKQAVEVSAKAAQYLRLQADIANAQKVEDQLDNRRRQIEMDRDLGMLNIDPFDPAKPALKPSHPSKRKTLPLALMFGLVLGGGLGYLRDWLDDRFRSLDEMKNAVGLPLLGTVPSLPEGLGVAVAGQQAVLEPSSDLAEACRTVRTAIYFGAPKDHCRTLVVTSPAPGDGKSTIASNLAITMAQAGKRVLLVDADLRLPSQHQIFHLRNAAGLSSLLDGQATLDQAVQPTEINGLEVLPCGPKPQNPSEMLNSPMFAELMEVLSDRYDQVIIDSPPVMGVADARIICACCDLTVLVLRSQKSTRRLSEMARDGLSSVGAQLLGIIINDVSSSANHPYGSYGYGRPRVSPPPGNGSKLLLRSGKVDARKGAPQRD